MITIYLDKNVAIDKYDAKLKTVTQLDNLWYDFLITLNTLDWYIDDTVIFEEGDPNLNDAEFTLLVNELHFDFYRKLKEPIEFARMTEAGKLEYLDNQSRRRYNYEQYTRKLY